MKYANRKLKFWIVVKEQCLLILFENKLTHPDPDLFNLNFHLIKSLNFLNV